jgi:hypothetical protein
MLMDIGSAMMGAGFLLFVLVALCYFFWERFDKD